MVQEAGDDIYFEFKTPCGDHVVVDHPPIPVSSRGSVSLFTTVFYFHTWHQEVWLDDDGMNDIFVKVIGIIKDLSMLEFLTCINIGNELGGFSTNVQDQLISLQCHFVFVDLRIVNKAIKHTFDVRFCQFF
jgi:hypothetical protein